MEFAEMVLGATRAATDAVLGTPVDGGTRTHRVVDPVSGKWIKRDARFAKYEGGHLWFQYEGAPPVALLSPVPVSEDEA